MVHPRRRDRLGDRLLEVDRVHQHLQHRRDDAAAAGRAGDENGRPVLEHDGRRHRGQRALARAGRIGGPAGEPERIGGAGLGGEIVERVVEQDAALAGHEAEPVVEIERGRHGDRVAVAVDDRHMGGVAAAARRRLARPDVDGKPRLLGVDAGAQRRRVVLRRQPLGRHVDRVAVAEIFGAVRIGELHRLDHQVKRRRRGGGEILRRESLQDVEHLDQMHAARRGRRHGDDVIAPIGAVRRLAQHRAVGFEVAARHPAARLAHRRHDLVGDRAGIEGARAVARDRLERCRQVALHQPLARPGRRAVGLEEDPGRGRPARQPRLREQERVDQVVLDRDAVARERERRRDQLGERELARAEAVERDRQARDRAGHSRKTSGGVSRGAASR